MRAPSAAFEYLLYQTLLGAWPLEPDDTFADRIQAYALKAAREGKQETSWLNPNLAYEEGVKTFLDRLLDRSLSAPFLDSLQQLSNRLSLLGALNSLSQITLKAMLPGLPDFYQGTEFWDFSMVDPDNRRKVDFAARATALAGLENPEWRKLAEHWQDGHLKLGWTRHLLKLRADLAHVFSGGEYHPLQVTGAHRDHVIAFARCHNGDAAIVVVGKSFAALTQQGRQWPRGEAIDGAVAIDGYRIEGGEHSESGLLPLSELFSEIPVAVLRAQIAGQTKPARIRRSRQT
jgi:(1->4)-alpha-D-glucan 1-alpha-D-glucosylmutase